MRFSGIEKKELAIAGLLISLAFAVLLSGGYRVFLAPSFAVLFVFAGAFFTAGLGFLLHELMHKFVAQSYGYLAEFRAYYPGLFFGLGLSFFGFIIAAPGAVHIRSYNRPITRERSGKISIAGPLSNIFLAVVFLILLLFVGGEGLWKTFFSYGLSINSLLAAFNLIPVRPFDGEAVKNWNMGFYVLVVILAVGLFALSWFL